jgi:membrane dipeptidase
MPSKGMIVDAHLDISWNALAEGSDFTGKPAPGHLISRATLSSAGVGLVFATLYCAPKSAKKMLHTEFVYSTPREAVLMAQAQLGYYRSVGLRLLRTRSEVRDYVRNWRRGQLAAVLLMEGADPIEKPAALGPWFDAGVRIVGPAWNRTRYSGGTGAPGGLTQLGLKLLASMKQHGMILDISHLADRAVADAFKNWRGPIMASHSDSRSITPGDRQITDATAVEIARRNGMLGVSFFRGHLRKSGPAGVDDVVAHVRHFADVAGGPEAVGLGTDLDGGFLAKDSPLRDLAGFSRLRQALGKHFSPAQVDGVMGRNWTEFLIRSLPVS